MKIFGSRARFNDPRGKRGLALARAAFAFSVPMAGAVLARAQSPVPKVPVQLCTAKTAFLGVGGGPTSVSNEEFKIGTVYGSLYRALESQGRYTLTSSAAPAELVMEVSITDDRESNRPPGITLKVRDMKTHALLWTFVQPVRFSARDKVFLKNIDIATQQIVTDLSGFAAPRSALNELSCLP